MERKKILPDLTVRPLTNPGWLAVYGRVAGVAAGKDELVGVDEGETARIPDLPIMREIEEGEELPAPIPRRG
jgi:hypothetical protein